MPALSKQGAALLLLLLSVAAAAVRAIPALSADDASLDAPLNALLDAALPGGGIQPPADGGASVQGPLVAPVPLNWEVTVEHQSIERRPWWRSAPAKSADGQQASAAIAAAQRAAHRAARQLSRDVQAVQAAALPPLTPLPSHGAPAHGWSLGGVQVDLSFDHNETVVGFSSSSDASERGAFDVRASWATTRRLVRLASGVQGVAYTEVSFSVSGLVLACCATCLLAWALRRYLPSARAEEEGCCEEEEPEGGSGGGRAAFLQASGYSKLASSPPFKFA